MGENIHEEIQELRHKELLYGMSALIIFVSLDILGFMLMLFTEVRYEWRGSSLYQITSHPLADRGLGMVIMGGILGIVLLVIAIYYSRKKKRLLRSVGIEQKWWD